MPAWPRHNRPQHLRWPQNSGADIGRAYAKFTRGNYVLRPFRKMTHYLLFNPFHSKQEEQDHLQERAEQARRGAMLSSRSTPVCGHCRSDDITCVATAQWSNENQEWELANTFDRPAHCNTCNRDSEIVWLPLN